MGTCSLRFCNNSCRDIRRCFFFSCPSGEANRLLAAGRSSTSDSAWAVLRNRLSTARPSAAVSEKFFGSGRGIDGWSLFSTINATSHVLRGFKRTNTDPSLHTICSSALNLRTVFKPSKLAHLMSDNETPIMVSKVTKWRHERLIEA